jgi:hypothetical protein
MTTTTTRHHMAINIEGILRQFKRKKITFFNNDDGSRMSDAQARQYIAECQAKGWKYLPCSNNCEGFDPFDKGCPGHPIPDNEPKTTSL